MTFDDLKFEERSDLFGGIRARVTFPNGFGASVIKGDNSYGGRDGLYELAVMGKDGNLTYETPITSDVEGRLTETAVSELLARIEKLK